MTKAELSPTQQSLLTSAAGCADRAIRWPANLRGGARTKIITALVEAGVAENRKGTLVVTDAGMHAVGVVPKAAPGSAERARRTKAADAPRKTRADSKQARLIAMLQAPEGATIAEIAAAFGWQAHYADARIMPM